MVPGRGHEGDFWGAGDVWLLDLACWLQGAIRLVTTLEL